MSAFFVSKATIDRCVSAIHYNAAYDSRHGMIYAMSKTSLGKDLWAMNRDAVLSRYPDEPLTAYDPKIAEYFHELTPPGVFQMLKSVQCLIYQCSEGDVPKRELYKQLERVAELLKDRIVSDLPAYQNAAWDL